MKPKFALLIGVLISLVVAIAVVRVLTNDSTAANAPAQQGPLKVPPLPEGVTELKFSEFFARPVGPRGLALTENLLKLDGKRVRMLGYMVHHDVPVPGRFIFSAIPVELHNHDSSDDLPAAVAYVSVPTCQNMRVPFSPGLMLLTGTLSVGPREEADGRMSLVRLALDPPKAEKDSRLHFTRKGVQQWMARTLQR